jgi:excinuclease UvrABC helicase subunit UvrB
LDKRIRKRLNERLGGLEYRQRAREQQRAVRQKAYQIASMMREQGTLKGARKYLEMKGIPFRELVDPASGNLELTIPEQITLSYDRNGRFLSSRPPSLSAIG